MSSPLIVPSTHEEPVASVLRILQLRKAGAGRSVDTESFVGNSLPQARRVYGGQVLAQGLLAAAATVEEEARLPHSLHAYFLRGGLPEDEIRFDVRGLRDGRSFSVRSVEATQGERALLTMTASFQGRETGLSAQPLMPQVSEPEETESALALFRSLDHPVAKFLGKTAAFDVRHVQKPLYVGPPTEMSPSQELWMRPRSQVPSGTSQVFHRALLTYVVDQVMLEPCLRSVGLYWSYPGLSLASLDHAMWFHENVDINGWLLFVGSSTSLGSGRAKADMQVFNRDGVLVASAAQEAMVRIPSEGQPGRGRWTFSHVAKPKA